MFPAISVSKFDSGNNARRLFMPPSKPPTHEKKLYSFLKERSPPKSPQASYLKLEKPISKQYEECKHILQTILHPTEPATYAESYKQLSKITDFIALLCNKIYKLENLKIDYCGFLDPKIWTNLIHFSDMNCKLIPTILEAARKIEKSVPMSETPSVNFISMYKWLALIKTNLLSLSGALDANLSSNKMLSVLKKEGDVFIEMTLASLFRIEKTLTEQDLENNPFLFLSNWRLFRSLYAQIALLEIPLNTLSEGSPKMLVLEKKANHLIKLFGFLYNRITTALLPTPLSERLLNDFVLFEKESVDLFKQLSSILGKENHLLANHPVTIPGNWSSSVYPAKKEKERAPYHISPSKLEPRPIPPTQKNRSPLPYPTENRHSMLSQVRKNMSRKDGP